MYGASHIQFLSTARRYDGTVRTANGSVVQFLYGEDGMDGTAIEAQKLDALRMPPGKFRVRARAPCPKGTLCSAPGQPLLGRHDIFVG